MAATFALSLAAPGPAARAMQLETMQEAGQQGITIGARAGTLGIGADVAVSLNDHFAVRGGVGLLGLDLDLTGRFGLADNRTAELSLPAAVYTLGAEASVGSLRVGAGLMVRSGDPVYEITYGSGATIDIGGGFYQHPEVRTLATTLATGSMAPYVLLGFGSHTERGLGFVADFGLARNSSPGFEMTPTGDPAVLNSPGFLADLETERRMTEDDAGVLADFWPIVSVGLRYGFR